MQKDNPTASALPENHQHLTSMIISFNIFAHIYKGISLSRCMSVSHTPIHSYIYILKMSKALLNHVNIRTLPELSSQSVPQPMCPALCHSVKLLF